MADQSGGREKEERKKLVLSHIGRELRKTLVLVETRTKKEVVDTIVDIFDPEFIVENRNALFALAVEGFKQQNGQVSGAGEIPTLSICQRRGPTSLFNNTMDLCNLYAYTTGLSDVFPKDLLNSKCKHLDLDSMQDELSQLDMKSIISKVGLLETLCEELKCRVCDLEKSEKVSNVLIQTLNEKLNSFQCGIANKLEDANMDHRGGGLSLPKKVRQTTADANNTSSCQLTNQHLSEPLSCVTGLSQKETLHANRSVCCEWEHNTNGTHNVSQLSHGSTQ